mmetsp:Transcript_17724/g.44297  ORF Transcript_17724/g.44297 Transcript_17724/m.44297 type:complete len:369 (-) Transcript_17724:2339-3445(-)
MLHQFNRAAIRTDIVLASTTFIRFPIFRTKMKIFCSHQRVSLMNTRRGLLVVLTAGEPVVAQILEPVEYTFLPEEFTATQSSFFKPDAYPSDWTQDPKDPFNWYPTANTEYEKPVQQNGAWTSWAEVASPAERDKIFNCVHTDPVENPSDKPGWWYVKFADGVPKYVSTVTFVPRADCCQNRLDGACVRLQVAGDLSEPSDEDATPDSCDITLPNIGRATMERNGNADNGLQSDPVDGTETISIGKEVLGFRVIAPSGADEKILSFCGIVINGKTEGALMDPLANGRKITAAQDGFWRDTWPNEEMANSNPLAGRPSQPLMYEEGADSTSWPSKCSGTGTNSNPEVFWSATFEYEPATYSLAGYYQVE